jgi:hypothetical protein
MERFIRLHTSARIRNSLASFGAKGLWLNGPRTCPAFLDVADHKMFKLLIEGRTLTEHLEPFAAPVSAVPQPTGRTGLQWAEYLLTIQCESQVLSLFDPFTIGATVAGATAVISAASWVVGLFRRRRVVDHTPCAVDGKPVSAPVTPQEVPAPLQPPQISHPILSKAEHCPGFRGLVQISVRTIKHLQPVFRGLKDWKNTIITKACRLALHARCVARAGLYAALRVLLGPQTLPVLRVVARVAFPSVVIEWLSPYQKGQVHSRDSLPIAPSFA